MKFLVGCLLSAFLSCFFYDLHAQVNVTAIRGKILTENNLSAEGATIILIKYKDSSIVNTGAAGKNGAFEFANINAGDYLILMSKAGCEKLYSGPYSVKSGQIFTAPDIILKPAVQKLNEVTINSTRPEIEAQPGKITLNVQNSILAQGNSAFDILRQSPGVRVDNNNVISIIGRQGALITIDGKPTNLTGEDLASVLKGIQSSTIDHIDLITSGSAKYDASGTGIVNIVLKKGKNNGFNASVTGTAGFGKFYKGNAGIVFNDRTAMFNIFGNYTYRNYKTFHDFTSDRDINFDNALSNYDVDYNSIQKSQNNSFGIGTDFYLSPTQTIGFLVTGSITGDNYTKDNNLRIYNQGILDSTITANSNLNRHLTRVNYNINYNGKLDKAGKSISADLNYNTFDRSSAEYITNMFYEPSVGQYRAPEWLQNLSPSNIHMWQSQIDFTDPISKTSKFEAGLKYSNVISNNDLIFGPFINGQYQSDPNFTNHFVYTENVNAAYVNFEDRFNKFDFTAALRAEQTIARGNSITLGNVVNSNYAGLFPTLMLAYKYDDKHDFSISYNRRVNRPNYEQVNPFLYYIDLYDYSEGNPQLKPAYSNNIELSYTYNKTFVATLYSNIITNADDFNFYEQNDTSKVNISTNVNFGTVYNYGLRLFVPVTFTNWWNNNFYLNAGYQRYVAYATYGNLNKGTPDIIVDISMHFIVSKTISAELLSHYESPSFYGVNQFKAYYNENAGISEQLFNKKGSLKLSVTDIFNTLRDRAHTNYQNLDMSTVDKKESQVITLTFTYRFGKISVKSTSRHTGNEDEKKRLPGGDSEN
ncbi:outer membrane beta-barrel protein [Mucilaginibacter sp.]|uniref:outer membrane beta-barrel protein n=1 Tax=Mucilaginibacter sp. TaxID=1882438 RepID=UPI0028410372|nr:outer membrane beta-barrel protein [Mucilaginibacter sp.]MDR3695372.1 TonB-dependent receptor [Mucilaginibacter sp.]